MKASPVVFPFLLFMFTCSLPSYTNAAPAAPLLKHLSSLWKWTRSSSSKTPKSEANFLQFENGYLVETVVEGNELGVAPYSIRVSQDGELFAVDADKSNIVRISPPLSRYSRARLVAGSFQGYTGYIDGKPSDARFNHPKGVTMDDKGNVYVADVSNLAIRKIGDAGVTTIAGGKSNFAGYRDGPSDDAKFSTDFDLVYVRPICSLLVVDRGNAALRQISLNEEDCDYQRSSISIAYVCLVVGAIVTGYAFCLLQQGFGSSFYTRTHRKVECQSHDLPNKDLPAPVVETVKVEQEAGWPSFGQLILDLSNLLFEAIGTIFLYLIPRYKVKGSKIGLTPLKDTLIMPEDEGRHPVTQKQRTPVPLSETHVAFTPSTVDKFSEVKPPKIRTSSMKDPSANKHRSSRRHEFPEYYDPIDASSYGHVRSKIHKERTKHRLRDKSGDGGCGGTDVVVPKPIEVKPMSCDDQKHDRYNFRSKYGDSNRFD